MDFRGPLLALLLLAPAVPAAAVEVRLTPELGAGGGYGSTLFIGSDFGGHAQAQISPGLAADLSTGPVLKILGKYRYTFARYFAESGAGAEGQYHEVSLTVRSRFSRAFDLDFVANGDLVAFSEPISSGGSSSGPLGTDSESGELGPLLRWRAATGTTFELSLLLDGRQSATEGADEIRERGGDLSALWLQRIAPWLDIGARYSHRTNRSSEPVFDYDGDGGTLFAATNPFGDLVLRGWLGLQWNRYEERVDRWSQLGVGLSQPLVEGTWLEASWSLADNRAIAGVPATWAEGSRSLTWLGLRAELPWWL